MTEFVSLHIALMTVSDTRTEQDDVSGQLLQDLVVQSGHILHGKVLVADDIYQIRAQISQWIADPAVSVVISSGGTGVCGRDSTPEAIAPLLDKRLDNFGVVFSQLSYAKIGASAMQSRACAGVANGTYVFVLPGSAGACRDAWEGIIGKQLNIHTRPCNLVELIPRLHESR